MKSNISDVLILTLVFLVRSESIFVAFVNQYIIHSLFHLHRPLRLILNAFQRYTTFLKPSSAPSGLSELSATKGCFLFLHVFSSLIYDHLV